jgi:hypothetical protein
LDTKAFEIGKIFVVPHRDQAVNAPARKSLQFVRLNRVMWLAITRDVSATFNLYLGGQ